MVRYQDNRPGVFRRFPFTAPLHGRPFRPQGVRLLFCILFGMLSYIWMVVCTIISSWRFPNFQGSVILPDALFIMLPQYNIYMASDILLYLLFAFALGRVIWHTRGLAIARRYLFISACLYVLRGLVVLVTSFPDPKGSCWVVPSTLWEIQETVILTCGDLMVSAHAIIVTLNTCIIQEYSRPLFPRIFSWVLMIICLMGRIIARQNYTVDILLGVLLPILCWKYYHVVIQLPSTSRSAIINWLEALDDDEVEGAAGYESCSQKEAKSYRGNIVSSVIVQNFDLPNEDCAGLNMSV
eukprot:TRINITY_DN1093_c0_g1_i1.p1 TRINITY_DN1093_c0_g1~~TRINITY_DN1093_c0_g1_i1.p1  ORF type:complete len:296 (-),score=9.61 TRINITY_DN1093_c0_g1_i1:254-1141(-)